MKNITRLTAVGLFALLAFCACNSTKNVTGYNPTKKTYHASPNVNDRVPAFVILHHTACNFDTAYMLLATKFGKVSVHYLVDKDGKILQLVDEKKRAFHAGSSSWFSFGDLNSLSIGIEIVNNGHEPFPQVQMDSVLSLLNNLETRYKFPARNFLGHMDIAPGRKVDPSAYFPWKRLAESGFGLWYDEQEATRMSQDSSAQAKLRDPMVNLMLLGYGVKKPQASIEAFKLHYTTSDKSGTLSVYDQCVLQLLANRAIADAMKQ